MFVESRKPADPFISQVLRHDDVSKNDSDDDDDENIVGDILFLASYSYSTTDSKRSSMTNTITLQQHQDVTHQYWKHIFKNFLVSYSAPKRAKVLKAALAYTILMILFIVPIITFLGVNRKQKYLDIFEDHEEHRSSLLLLKTADILARAESESENMESSLFEDEPVELRRARKTTVTLVDLEEESEFQGDYDHDGEDSASFSYSSSEANVESYESPALDPSTLPQKLQEYIVWHKQQLDRVAKQQQENAERRARGEDVLAPESSSSSSSDPPVKYVLYTCDKTISKCRGLGDRMRGIISLFYYAVLTKRVFGIHWDTPVPLQDTLVPSHVDWISADHYVARYTTPEERVPIRLINKNFLLFRKSMFDEDDNDNELFGHPDEAELQGTVLRDRNETALLVATNAAYHYLEMWDLGLRDALGFSEDAKESDYPLAAWALQLLFKPSQELEVAFASKMRDFGLKPGDPYVASHVRLGSKSKTFFELRRHRVNDVHNFSTCALRMREYIAANPGAISSEANPMRLTKEGKTVEASSSVSHIPVFLASDSNVAKREMIFMIPDLIYVEEDAFHVDRSTRIFRTREAKRLNMLAFVELLFLIRSSCMVASKSGFSYIAILWSMSMQEQRRCWSFPFEQCLDPSSFVHNKLFINPGNKYLYG